MKSGLRYYFVLWLAAVVLAFMVSRLLHGSGGTHFWMPVTSLPTVDGRSIPFPSWGIISRSEIWYYLILSIAGGITVAEVVTVIARSAIARNWKRAGVWLGGLLCFILLAYVTSLLAYSVGPWQKIGVIVLYNTRGPLGPTLVFATAIIIAKLLSNAAGSNAGKRRLFLSLSGLVFVGILILFIPPPMNSPYAFVTLLALDGLAWIAFALILVFAVVKLAAGWLSAD
jgi:hypothetical protein